MGSHALVRRQRKQFLKLIDDKQQFAGRVGGENQAGRTQQPLVVRAEERSEILCLDPGGGHPTQCLRQCGYGLAAGLEIDNEPLLRAREPTSPQGGHQARPHD